MARMDVAAKKVVTPEFRVSFPSVFKARAFGDQEPKFSVTMLFDKNADLGKLKQAMKNAAVEKWGPDEKKWPKNLRKPLRNGDEKADVKGYKGKLFLVASSKQAPDVVDQNLDPIIEESRFYAGCYARAELLAFAYDTAGNRGISFALQNLQKTRDGEALSGRKKANEVFSVVETGEDDASNYGTGDSTEDSDDESVSW